MDYAKQRKLVERLVNFTRSGSIDWKPYLQESVFNASFRENTVRIGLEEGRRQEEGGIVIRLINGDGVVVGSFSNVDLQAEHTAAYDPQLWSRIMMDLFVEARRRALAADKEILERVINEILSDLDFRTPTPPPTAVEKRLPPARTQARPLEVSNARAWRTALHRQHGIVTGEPRRGCCGDPPPTLAGSAGSAPRRLNDRGIRKPGRLR